MFYLRHSSERQAAPQDAANLCNTTLHK